MVIVTAGTSGCLRLGRHRNRYGVTLDALHLRMRRVVEGHRPGAWRVLRHHNFHRHLIRGGQLSRLMAADAVAPGGALMMTDLTATRWSEGEGAGR